MNSNKHFAAFIMTYQRNITLSNTINILLKQSHPPQKILIIDNDPEQSAKYVSQKLSHLPIEYFSVGYNSGPAGAAKKGLEILSKENYDWIAWIDDDDPPIFDNTFEILLKLANDNEECGCVGSVGQRFNRKNGLIERVSDYELEGLGYLQVDTIAGNMCKIVNSKIIKNTFILPDESLFFGFEELDFDLRIQNSGYLLLVDKELYKKHRVNANRIGIKVKRGTKKPIVDLWRQYYSSRNSLFILKKNNLNRAIVLNILRTIFNMANGFRFGLNYGKKNLEFNSLALYHFCIGKKGKQQKIK